MSTSPANQSEIKQLLQADSEYQTNLSRLNKMMKMGGSLSGHERNCAFLNLGGESFATVSSVAGIDFADDGRGVATTDWDGDGDLDFWTTNRTGPRLRLMRNDLDNGSSHLSLRLVGTKCNRDAIGARVILKLADSETPIIKTVRAGEGYLSQSSKTLHFGLGMATVESATVQWPGCESQVFAIPPGPSFMLKQGTPDPVALADRGATVNLSPVPQPVGAKRDGARVAMLDRIPVPALPVCRSPGAEPVGAVRGFSNHGPVAITLWASWCQQCRNELAEVRGHADLIHESGIHFMAVNVDDQFPDAEQDNQAKVVLESIDWQDGDHLQSTYGNEQLMQRLRVLHELQFGRPLSMPVPVTFLINRRRELSIIYRGRVSVEQLLADAKHIDLADEDWAASVLPLPGRWNEPPAPLDILEIPRSLLETEQTQHAFAYVQQNEERLANEEELPTIRAWLADQLVSAGQGVDGRRQFEKALEASPDDVTIMNNLAWLAATHESSSVRDGTLAAKWAEKAARATKGNNPIVLDTLAAAYAEQGEFGRATKVIERAVRLATAAENSELLNKLKSRMERYEKSLPFREQ